MEGYIGQIIMFGGNFAPRNWFFCSGQLLPIASYQSLFSIIGTTYGGDGRSTFALPDLRGRAALRAAAAPAAACHGETNDTARKAQLDLPIYFPACSCIFS